MDLKSQPPAKQARPGQLVRDFHFTYPQLRYYEPQEAIVALLAEIEWIQERLATQPDATTQEDLVAKRQRLFRDARHIQSVYKVAMGFGASYEH